MSARSISASAGNTRLFSAEVVNALVLQCRVLYALILRETKTRYGEHKLGFVWAFIEPVLMILLMYVIFGSVRSLATGNMHLALFIVCGFVPFTMFRNTMSQTQGAITQNTSLLGFPQVTTFDLILARALLEIAVFLAVFGILVLGIALLGVDARCEDPLGVLTVCFLMWLLGLGLGFIFSSLAPIIPSTRQITGLLLGRPLFLASGLFYTVDAIPSGAREIMLYNPVLHLVELSRSAYFYEFESAHASWSYATFFSVGTFAFGLIVHRAMRKKAIIGL